MDNLKQRIEEIILENLENESYAAKLISEFIQENFVPKEQYEVMKDAMESWKEKVKNPNEF